MAIGNNQNISFLPAISSISTRMHGEFLRLIFLQAHREIEAHFTATGAIATQPIGFFRFKRAAFFRSLKSKVGLAAAKAAALLWYSSHRPSAHSFPRSLLSHNLTVPRVHKYVMGRLVHTGLGSSSLVAHVLQYPPPPTQTAL